MQEIWKDAKGYEEYYEISNLGKVRNKINKNIKKQTNNGRGYMSVNLWHNNKGNTKYVHRLVAESFIKNADNKPEVHHKDSDRSNNCVDNLAWVTSKENNNFDEHLKRLTSNENWIKTRKSSMAKAREKSIVLNSYKTVFEKDGVEYVFDSLALGCRELGLDKGGATRVANGKQKHTHGYKIRYIH